jgi:hypothetical protein
MALQVFIEILHRLWWASFGSITSKYEIFAKKGDGEYIFIKN